MMEPEAAYRELADIVRNVTCPQLSCLNCHGYIVGDINLCIFCMIRVGSYGEPDMPTSEAFMKMLWIANQVDCSSIVCSDCPLHLCQRCIVNVIKCQAVTLRISVVM